jgi:bifunctional non-homologous end joining protein LigD
MGLDTYRKKRRFDVTSEPAGADPEGDVKEVAPARELAFVVQKHRATMLHYDLRLEWKGVMLSWAVPKGPCYDPAQKRIAMKVEDHPMEYNDFEGIIPEGEYGGGTVMIWDRGTWSPEVPDVEAALAKGDLKLSFAGTKLRGSWVLVRIRPRKGEAGQPWLLIKHRDCWVSAQDITELAPRSVVSNRLLIEIARDEGGNLRKAADGDPPALLQQILANPALLAPPKRDVAKAVWHSKPKAAGNKSGKGMKGMS